MRNTPELLKFEFIKSNLGSKHEINLFDSTLVVNQLNGLFKIKDARLRISYDYSIS